MMHGREKSDPAIVAMKPANNAVLAAEPENVSVKHGWWHNMYGMKRRLCHHILWC